MKNILLINLIKTYTTFEWLVFIKTLENKSDEELLKIEPDEFQRNVLINSNWYSKLLDLALRLSDYEKTKVNLDNLPRIQDYKRFIEYYLKSYDSESNFKADLDYSLDLALAKYTYEQLKNYAAPVNNMGRLLELYKEKEALFKEYFGLTPKQILFFYFLYNARHNIYEAFDLSNILRLIKGYDYKIKEEQLKRFLEVFSIDIKGYRFQAKELGITKNTMKSIRIIEQHPIVRLKNEKYFIPSTNVLLEALTYKVFSLLNNKVISSKNFKQSFGDVFENYLRNLTKFSHSEYLYECNELVKDIEDREKAEFYLLKGDSVLIIESKLLHIDEHIILNSSVIELEKKFKKTIYKALSQIDSCFKKLDVKNKYAVIVIHTHIPMLDNFIKIFKNKAKYEFLDNVMILSVVDYEIMIHNPFENIIEYFELRNTNAKSQIALHFEQRNEFLVNSCLILQNDIKRNSKNDLSEFE